MFENLSQQNKSSPLTIKHFHRCFLNIISGIMIITIISTLFMVIILLSLKQLSTLTGWLAQPRAIRALLKEKGSQKPLQFACSRFYRISSFFHIGQVDLDCGTVPSSRVAAAGGPPEKEFHSRQKGVCLFLAPKSFAYEKRRRKSRTYSV